MKGAFKKITAVFLVGFFIISSYAPAVFAAADWEEVTFSSQAQIDWPTVYVSGGGADFGQ